MSTITVDAPLPATPASAPPTTARPADEPIDVTRPRETSGPATDIDLDALAAELDAIREQVLDSLGEEDAAYIRRLIRTQRSLDLAGRAALLVGIFPPAWVLGVGLLSLAKILENMEIGHNVLHGQWDWMNDPEIHSTTWEWDHACPAEQWKHSHNYMHHQWTNVRGMDRDIGYGAIRIDPEEPWHRSNLAQPAIFVTLATLFDYGISVHDNYHLNLHQPSKTDFEAARPKLVESWEKVRSQGLKDFVFWPLLSAPLGLPAVLASAAGGVAANVVRNWWTFTVIFNGHFPDDVELFEKSDVEHESRGGWYRRQILGSANFTGGWLTHVLTGNLDHQIEHHLFPDVPSRRYAEIAPQVQDICRRYGLHYNSKSIVRQFGTVVRKVLRLSLPDRRATA